MYLHVFGCICMYLYVLAGDPDTNRHTKFDPHTAPPVKGSRATEERARLAMLLSAFGTLSPQHTEAWTRREGAMAPVGAAGARWTHDSVI